jgi:hypothetical protein
VLSVGGPLTHDLKITGAAPSAGDTTYDLVAGKTRTVRDHYNQLSVDFQEPEGKKRKLRVIVRAYDDGVAFRYVLPQQPGLDAVNVRNEETRFDFPADYRCWGLNLGKFGTSHEGEFDPVQASKLREHNLYDAPWSARGSQRRLRHRRGRPEGLCGPLPDRTRRRRAGRAGQAVAAAGRAGPWRCAARPAPTSSRPGAWSWSRRRPAS